jgi:hypothetical protein
MSLYGLAERKTPPPGASGGFFFQNAAFEHKICPMPKTNPQSVDFDGLGT